MLKILRMKCAGVLRWNRHILTAALASAALTLALIGDVQFCQHNECAFWKSVLTTPEPECCALAKKSFLVHS